MLRNQWHFYTLIMNSQKETKKRVPFTITTTKNMGYLRINLTKEVKDLYLENYRTLKKSTEEDTNKWKNIPCS